MADPAHPERELERLRRENEGLNEQVKLLVQTEQRLYRSQNRLDAQLVRMRLLARFALESEGFDASSTILTRGIDILSEAFALDWIGVVGFGLSEATATLCAASEATRPLPPPVALDPVAFAWLTAPGAPIIALRSADPGAAAPFRILSALTGGEFPVGAPDSGGRLARIPLSSVGDECPGAILAYVGRRAMALMRDGLISDDHIPFLQLLANHMDHQVANAQLNGRLTVRSAELAASLETLEATQLQLVQAQKLEAVGRLAGGVAHDFNNLLTVILGYAGTLQSALPLDTPERANVNHILAAGQRAAGITAQLLALSRRQMQRPEAVDLSGHTEATVGLLKRLVGERIRLELRLDRTLPAVRADRSQLEQVLLNLVLNARDALPDGGDLSVTTRAATPADVERCEEPADHETFAVLEVVDTGVGMDDATRERIFEPFFSTKGAGKGSGLGLAVVYGVVKQSGGHVFVDSAPGAGARFTVLWPIDSSQTAAAPPAPDATERTEPPRARGSIMVVEDEPGIRQVIVLTLRQAGYTVTAAEDGAKALALLHAAPAPPDLILTDVIMPNLGGIELERELRRTNHPTPLAYMSGYSEALPEALTTPTPPHAPFLPKPFAPATLVTFVARQFALQAAK